MSKNKMFLFFEITSSTNMANGQIGPSAQGRLDTRDTKFSKFIEKEKENKMKKKQNVICLTRS